MKKRLATLAILTIFGVLGTANATVIGTLLTGSAGDITVSLTSITWNTDPSSSPAGPPWNGEVAVGTNLRFAGCATGVLGSAGCLTVTEAIEINNNVPLTPSTVLPENNFLIFGGPNGTAIDFILQQVLGGSSNTNCAALAVGDSCSLFAGSPIILTLLSGGRTGATLNLAGIVTDGVSPASTWIGGFGATLNNTPAFFQNFFCPGGVCSNTTGTISSSNSGSFFATATPEPGTIVLIGGGLIGLAGLLRRRNKA